MQTVFPDDDALRALLLRVRTIAVVGIKGDPGEDAHRVPRYMQAQGYTILGVSPKLERVLDGPCVATLAELEETPDLVNLFRAPAHVPAHADEILALAPRPLAVWMQLGIRCPESAARLREAGIGVVEDRCLLVEHRRLLGGGRPGEPEDGP